jgi:hypothetical protein
MVGSGSRTPLFPDGLRKVREQGFPRLGSFHGRETRPDDTVVQASGAPFQDSD